MDRQSTGFSIQKKPVQFLRLDAWNEQRWSFFLFSNVYSATPLCCAVSVIIMGFYLFPWHMDEGFHRAFVASHTISPSLCCTETWVWRQGENFFMTGIRSPSSHSPSALSFCFSLNILIQIFSPSFCIFCNTAPSCLHIACSKTTNWSFTTCTHVCFLSLFLSHPSLLSSLVLCLLSLVASLGTQNKMQDTDEMNWHIENGIVGR